MIMSFRQQLREARKQHEQQALVEQGRKERIREAERRNERILEKTYHELDVRITPLLEDLGQVIFGDKFVLERGMIFDTWDSPTTGHWSSTIYCWYIRNRNAFCAVELRGHVEGYEERQKIQPRLYIGFEKPKDWEWEELYKLIVNDPDLREDHTGSYPAALLRSFYPHSNGVDTYFSGGISWVEIAPPWYLDPPLRRALRIAARFGPIEYGIKHTSEGGSRGWRGEFADSASR